ncbi:MAG: YigZ family protein [Gemmatimonadota bacterium]
MGQAGYPVPTGPAEVELRFRNSRFIGAALPADTVEAARAAVQARRQLYPDASHHVFAFAVGHGATVTHGMSDDGEPSGTAGRPVLAVVQGSGMGDLVVVVTRYFGGTKLGTGGLVRAYTAAAQAALQAVVTETKTVRVVAALRLPYDCFEPCRLALRKLGAEVLEESFGAEVVLRVLVEATRLDELRERIRDMTSGRVSVAVEGAGPDH